MDDTTAVVVGAVDDDGTAVVAVRVANPRHIYRYVKSTVVPLTLPSIQ